MRSKLILTMSLILVMSVVLSACSGATNAATAPATQAAPTAAAQVDWSKMKSAAEGGGMDALIAAAKAGRRIERHHPAARLVQLRRDDGHLLEEVWHQGQLAQSRWRFGR